MGETFTMEPQWGMAPNDAENNGKPRNLHASWCNQNVDRAMGTDTLITWNRCGQLEALHPKGPQGNRFPRTLAGTWECQQIYLQLIPQLKCRLYCVYHTHVCMFIHHSVHSCKYMHIMIQLLSKYSSRVCLMWTYCVYICVCILSFLHM